MSLLLGDFCLLSFEVYVFLYLLVMMEVLCC